MADDSTISNLNVVTSLNGTERLVLDQTTGATTETKRALLSMAQPTVNVKWFGAVGDGVTNDTTAIQDALDYMEQEGRVGGIVFVPKGTYLCTDTLRVGGFTRLVGENFFTSSLVFSSAHASGNCIELGPDESGDFAYSGSYVFGCRIENMDINASDVDRGATAAVVYTQGAHQPSGLWRVNVRNFRNTGVRHAVGNGGPAQFTIDETDIQSSSTAPAAGNTIGLWCDAGGAIINLYRSNIQGTSGRSMTYGIYMQKDSLNAIGCHLEYATVGISLEQNESTIRTNTLVNITGHSGVSTLINVAATNNLSYALLNINNTTGAAVSTNVLVDNEQGLTIGGTNGRSITQYNSGVGEALEWGFGIAAPEGTSHVHGDTILSYTGNNGTTQRAQEFTASIASTSAAQTKVIEFTIPASTMFAFLEIVMVGSRANASDTVGTSQVAKTYASIGRRGSGYDVILDTYATPSFEETSTTAGGATNKSTMSVAISRSGAEANTAPQAVQITAVPGDSAGTTSRLYCYVRAVSHSVLVRSY